jgi:basic membrane protein A
VGVGVINEAKTRAAAGKEVWVVGVDVDQYADGIYDGKKSIILTSATKRIDHAAFDMIKAELEGTFPGGMTLIFDAANFGVGIPWENPNLREDVQKEADAIFAKLQSGEIKVSAERGDLIK